MARLEELTRGAAVKGVLPNGPVAIVDSKELNRADARWSEPDCRVTSVGCKLGEPLARAEAPA